MSKNKKNTKNNKNIESSTVKADSNIKDLPQKSNVFIKIISKWKLLICYTLVAISIIIFLYTIIAKPTSSSTTYLYNTGNDTYVEELALPLTETLTFDVDNVYALSLYLEDSTLTDYVYTITVTNYEGEELFNSTLQNNESAIYIYLGQIANSSEQPLYLNIYCDDCQTVQATVSESLYDTTSIEGLNNTTLILTADYIAKDNSYYWYVALLLVIAFILYPLARGEYNE